MKKYVVRDRESGVVLEIVRTLEEAEELLEEYENEDRNENVYIPDFYEIAEVDV